MRRWDVKGLLLAMLVVLSPFVTAQGVRDLEGTWVGVCSDCAPNAMPGGLAKTLVILVSASELTIRRDGFPVERYRFNGVDTQLPDGRTATAASEEGSLVLTTVRKRSRTRDEVYQTILRHVYRVSGNTLSIERFARAIRPNEPPSDWAQLGTVAYRRDSR